MISTAELKNRLEVALEASWRAGKITLEYYQAVPSVQTKDDGSPVTQADLKAEQHIRRLLTKHFPHDAIVGEEGEKDFSRVGGKGVAGGTWYVDPIDGTRSFVCGVPFYGVLIAFEAEGEVLLGTVSFPALNESIWAMRGEGCHWNGRRARVSAVPRLEEATLLTTDCYQMEKSGPPALWQQLCVATRMQRTWGDAYGHILVATGRADIMIDPRMNVWDCGPLLPILQEAGGRFTDWNGEATIHGENAFSTNGLLHDDVRKILSGKHQPGQI
jgi:histidinol phosphatase-like enzyme (inositol monophosphatase family)